ncbi:MAG: hypothetical protein J6Q49_01510 [Kiritimatiellae bacterium]|nr:hypothetical protein [Kiritimatiellia bacterium]
MSININPNTNAVNWESLLNAIDGATKTEGTQGVADTRSVTFTTTVDGVETPVTVKIPDDLELPATVDSAAIDSLCEKLVKDTGLNFTEEQIKQIHDTLSSTLEKLSGAVNTDPTVKTVMFDLYKLMALLVEVAQKQRDAMREMRLAENLSVQKAILDQASAQREAAVTGMIAGAICCAMQVAATGVAMYQQAKAFNSQLGTEKTSGLDVARQSVDMMKAANTQDSAQTQLNKVKSEVGTQMSLDGHTRITSKVEGGFNNGQVSEAQARFTEARDAFQNKAEVSQAMQVLGSDANIDTVTSAELNGFDAPEVANVKTAVAKLDAFKAEAAKLDRYPGLSAEDKAFFADASTKPFESLSMADRTRMMQLKMSNGTLSVDKFNFGDKPLAQLKADVKTAFDAANADLKAQIAPGGPASVELEAAKANLRAQTKLEIQKYEDSYGNALQEYNDATKNGTKAEIAAASQKLDTAAAELKYARALGNAKLMQPDVTDAKTHLADVNETTAAYQAAQQTRANSVDYIKASNTITKAQAVNNLIAAIGSAGQSFIQNLTQMQQADATAQGALSKKSEEELDQTKDLFNQALSLVDSIVKLMQAVRAAEAQSMRDAIQA